jgi:uncharacterized protein YgfB (UPF0149 family)
MRRNIELRSARVNNTRVIAFRKRTHVARSAHLTSSSATPPLDYDRLRDSLAAAGAIVALAELHGGVCGALCAGGPDAARRWLLEVLDDADAGELVAAVADDLDELIDTSSKMLEEGELAFEPLLPSDDALLAEQVEALALWCQGFLSGVGSTAPAAATGSVEGDALGEILRDFAEISRAGLSDDEAAGQDQPDFALAEIQEYVRVSVQIAFEELTPVRAAAAAREVH